MAKTSTGQKHTREDDPAEGRPARRARSDGHSMSPEHSPVIDDEDDSGDDGLPFWDLEKTVSSLCYTGLRRYIKHTHCSGG